MKSEAKRLVITGCTRGLGRAMAAGFAAAGHTVAGCGRSGKDIAALAQQFGPPHRFDVVDVSDNQAVSRWAKSVLETHGPPDFLLNNAAIVNRNAVLWEVPAEEFDRVIDVNLKGTVNTIRHFVPAMIQSGKGIVVNFSSLWGRSTAPEVAPYNCTKFGVEGLSKALAQELPAPLAAIPLNPGIIDTDMLRSCFGGGAKRYPSPEEWAKSAVPFILGLGRKDNGKSLSVPG
jgi:NAD(P)-dependent dehydrogenase (short-subunit alcohol dehydrogenase family)